MDIIYHQSVRTCQEAASARGIDINEELKTIILKIGHKRIAVHLRGGDMINSRLIQSLFRHRSRFLSMDELKYYNLAKGLVNPWNIKFCEYNLIATNILNYEYMYTNNSKLDEGVKFQTQILLNLPNIIIGDFGYEKN